MHLFHKQNIFQIDFLPIVSKTQKHSKIQKRNQMCSKVPKYPKIYWKVSKRGKSSQCWRWGGGPTGNGGGSQLIPAKTLLVAFCNCCWSYQTSCQYQTIRMITVVEMRKGKRNSEDEGEIVILMLVLSLVTILVAMLRERECCSQFWTWPCRGLPVAARVLQTTTTRRKSSSPLSSQ